MLKNIIKMCPLLPGLLFGVASHSINAAERSLFDVDIAWGGNWTGLPQAIFPMH